MKYARLDFILSYWIFAWFILYLTGIVKTAPNILILLGIIVNLGELIYLIYSRASAYNITKFTIINLFLKLIPLVFIWNNTITTFEIKLTIVVLISYLLWIYINNVSILDYYNHFLENYRADNGSTTILSDYYDKLYGKN